MLFGSSRQMYTNGSQLEHATIPSPRKDDLVNEWMIDLFYGSMQLGGMEMSLEAEELINRPPPSYRRCLYYSQMI